VQDKIIVPFAVYGFWFVVTEHPAMVRDSFAMVRDSRTIEVL
jgi:hypothetical protein